MTWTQVASGTACFSGASFEGTLLPIEKIQDILAIMKNPVPDGILLTQIAGGTTIAPVIKHIGGVICTIGSTGSHIAIVSREFHKPCVVAAKGLEVDVSLRGRRARIDSDGTISLLAEESDAVAPDTEAATA